MSHPTAHSTHTHHASLGYGTAISVWLALLALTLTTVTLAGLQLGPVASLFIGLGIATAKAFLVVAFFMHLYYEDSVFHNMLFIALITLSIIFGLTFPDYFFR